MECEKKRRYGLVPFWFWNSEHIDREGIVRGLDQFVSKGFRAVLIHTRVGHNLDYLSEEYMALVAFTVEQARERDMQVWLYDEDNWPSGYAGGRVTALGSAYLQQHLWCAEVSVNDVLPENSVALFACEYKEGRWGGYRRMDLSAPIRDVSDQDKLLVFHVVKFDGNSAEEHSHLKQGYVDLLNPQVVEAFIQSTYEVHSSWLGDAFGHTIPAIFTDEPSLRADDFFITLPKVVWTPDLPRQFMDTFGFDLTDHLPALYYNAGKDYRQIRHHFHRLISDRFVETYTKTIALWCREHGIALAGHMLLEETLHFSAMVTGSPMHHYEWMDIPGIDHLGAVFDEGKMPEHAVMVKQVQSVKNQLNKPFALSETFGASGHGVPLSKMKELMDWQLTLGINLFTPHASFYTLAGIGKRDHPPSLFEQQPFWAQAEQFSVYAERAAKFVSAGCYEADWLLVLPLESVWSTHTPLGAAPSSVTGSWPDDVCDAAYVRIVERLLQTHVSFDIGEEGIIERYGKVSPEGKLSVGVSTYRGIVLPPVLTLRRSTLRLLELFIQAGGTVLVCSPTLERVDGVRQTLQDTMVANLHDAAMSGPDFAASIPLALDQLTAAVLQVPWPQAFQVNSTSSEGRASDLRVHRRVLEDGSEHLMVMNIAENPVMAALVSHGEKLVEQIDCQTWQPRKIQTSGDTHYCAWTDRWEPKEARFYKLRPICERQIRFEAMNNWRVEPETYNTALLDVAAFALAEAEPEEADWSEPMPLGDINSLRKSNPDRWSSESAWFRFHLYHEYPDRGATTDFMAIVLERSDLTDVWINEMPLAAFANDSRSEWHLDRELHLYPIRLKPGRNEVKVRRKPDSGRFVENLYVVGGFRVNIDPVRGIVLGPETHHFEPQKDLARQGYPFFAGTLRFHSSFDAEEYEEADGVQWFIDLPDVYDSIELALNDSRNAICSAWHHQAMDVTELVRKGENTLCIRLHLTLRAMLGPHRLQQEPSAIGPEGFERVERTGYDYLLPSIRMTGCVRKKIVS